MVAESPPKPGLIKTLIDNGITACNGGGWQASDASQTSHAVATDGDGANDDNADKRRRFVKQLQTVLAESEWGYAQASSTKEFDEILAEAANLFGAPEGDRIIEEVLKEAKREFVKLFAKSKPEEAEGKACTGKRTKGKAAQRKGYG